MTSGWDRRWPAVAALAVALGAVAAAPQVAVHASLNPAPALRAAIHDDAGPSATLPQQPRAASSDGRDIRLDWDWAVTGTPVGFAGLHVADLAGDGVERIIVSGAAWSSGYPGTQHIQVLSKRPWGYEPDWTSDSFTGWINSLRVVNADADEALEIIAGVDGRLLVYDGASKALQASIATPANRIRSLEVADVDGDGALEYVFCGHDPAVDSYPYDGPDPLWVVDAAGKVEHRGGTTPCHSVAVGNVDDDPGLEIVVGQQSGVGWVLDGATRGVEWLNYFGFYGPLQLADVDGDGRSEVVSRYAGAAVGIFDADLQSLTDSIETESAAALRVLDVDGDGSLEIALAGSGGLRVHDASTRALKWSDTTLGASAIAGGELDGDAAPELVLGGGRQLVVVDSAARTREWSSDSAEGPFFALSHGDVDADGVPELLYASEASGYDDSGLLFVRDAATYAPEYVSESHSWRGGTRSIRHANVDGDPAEEIFFSRGGSLRCIDGASHAEQWQLVSSSAAFDLGDVDLDGSLELVVGRPSEEILQAYDAATGVLKWQGAARLSWHAADLVRIANVDADPQPEILIAGSDGLRVVDRVAGTIDVASWELVTALDTADVDGDSRDEIVAGTEGGNVIVFGATSWVAHQGDAAIQALAVRDLDGDGTLELVFTSRDEVFVHDRWDSLLWQSGRLPSGVAEGDGADSLLVADIDGDGFTEIAVGLTRGVRVYEVRQLFPRQLSISDVSVVEGQRSSLARFFVRMSAPTSAPVSVAWSTAADTALAGSDYAAVQGTITFAAGDTLQAIDVPVLGDFVHEPTERFRVLLGAATNAVVADGVGLGTIVDDDEAGLAVDDVTLYEPEAGIATAVFTVTIAPAPTSLVTVDYVTEDGTASSPEDYLAVSGRLEFPPGTTARTVEVTISADELREAPESFSLRLDNPAGATIARDVGTAWIRHPGTSSFYTVTPCRALDTRLLAATLKAGVARTFAVGGLCGVPVTARAVAATLTVTNASAPGYVTIVPGDLAPGSVSSLNFRAGATRAGNGILPLSADGKLKARSGQAAGAVDFVLDVTGYFE